MTFFSTNAKTYYQEQYQFFIGRGYQLFKTGHDRYCVPYALNPNADNSIISPSLLQEIHNENEYLDFCMKRNRKSADSSDEFAQLDFFIQFYKNHPEFQTELLHEFPKITNTAIKNTYLYFVDNVKTCKDDIIPLIHSFRISLLKVQRASPDDLISYLEKNDFNDNEINQFIFRFYKNRDKQLKDPNVAPAVRDFLLKRFNSNIEQLSPYFSFFPFLEASFKEMDLDVFEEEHQFSHTIAVNCSKMVNSFCIDQFKSSNYKEVCIAFSNGIADFYQTKTTITANLKDNKALMEITFLHDNPELNVPLIKQRLIGFIKHIKHAGITKASPQIASSWLKYEHLNTALKDKTNITLKNKI